MNIWSHESCVAFDKTGRRASQVANASLRVPSRRATHLQAPTAERIEAALATLRRALQPDAAHPPVRASTLTLLVLVSGDAAAARAAVAHLAATHPSRTIVITAPLAQPAMPHGAAPPALAGTEAPSRQGELAALAETPPEHPEPKKEERASRQGELAALVETAAVPDGGAGRVLHEVITLEAHSPAALPLVAGLVPALILGELPAYTWTADAGALDALCAGQCRWLIEASDGLLVESSPPAGGDAPGRDRLQRLLALIDRLAGQVALADLTWVRLEPWREAVAQCFDPPACRGWAFMVTEVEVLFERAASAGVTPDPPAGALLLGGWLQARLPSHPPVSYRAVPGGGRAAGDVAGVRLQARGPNGQAHFTVERQRDRASAAIRLALPGRPEVSRLVRLPLHDRAELLGLLLQRTHADPFYQEALEASLGRVSSGAAQSIPRS
jgi:glucose-6-phosphate dehydrogenase assembly protein OpcA